MNNIIIVGSILMFVCVFIASLDYGHLMSESVNKHICMVRNMPETFLNIYHIRLWQCVV